MNVKKPSLFVALIPIVFLIILLSINVWIFGDDTISGSNQLVLLFAATLATILGSFYKVKFKDMLDGAVASITSV